MALEVLDNSNEIRHFDDGGSTGAFSFGFSEPTGTVSVSGAPGFDAGYYMAANPDVAQNWGGDAYSHYVAHGQSEGRAASAPAAPSGALNIASADFNPQAYAQQAGAAYTPPPPPATAADITNLYTNVLKRPEGQIDQQGFDFWLNAAQQGTPLSVIEKAFYESPEYQQNQNSSQSNTPEPGTPKQTQTSSGIPYSNIANAVQGTLANTSLTAQQQADKIYSVAKEYNVNAQDIANALGIPFSQVQDYFNQAGQGSYVNPVTETVVPTGSTAAIEDWYNKTLYRKSDTPGLNYWSQRFGDTLDPAELAILNASTEAQNKNALSTYYPTVTGRTADASGLNFWYDKVAKGEISLADAKKGIAESSEAQLYSAYKDTTGRIPDPSGAKYYQDQLAAGKTIAEIRAEMAASDEGQKYAVNSLYKNALFRDATPAELTEITGLLKQGYTIDQLREKAYAIPEVMVTQDFMNYLGRTPDAAGLKFWTDALASGQTKAQISQGIALSDESIRVNTPSIKAVLEATLGKDIVAGLTPEQINGYARTILDPARPGPKMPVSKDEFDANFYLQNNKDVAADGIDPYTHYIQNGIYEGRAGNAAVPAYLTQAENLLEVYKNIALDPILGPKLKAENPMLWEKVTPLTSRPDELKTTDRIHYGQYGTVKVGGVDVPILNGKRVDQLLGRDGFGTLIDFSHHRGTQSHNLGWSSNSFSNKLARGAEAIGVIATPYTDEFGKTTYEFQGLNEAAKIVGVDPSKFQAKQVQATTKNQYDADGQLVQKAGEPAFQTDEYGVKTPVMEILSRDQQLYDAINQAAKDIYLYTGDSLTSGKAHEGGAESFNTVLYKRSGDELIPITAPIAHGGYQNMDVYTGGSGFSFMRDVAPGLIFVGAAALAMVTAGQSMAAAAAAAEASAAATAAGATAAQAAAAGAAAAAASPSVAAAIGSALALEGTAAVIAGNVVLGSTIGAANAAASGGNVVKAGLTGAVTAGITSSMGPLMQAGDMGSSIQAVSDATNGLYSPSQVANIVSATLANTIGTAVSGASGDTILKSFGTALAANGISQAGVTAITKGLEGTLSADTIAKIARASQLVSNTVATSALTGKNQEQIVQSLITQLSNPTNLINAVSSVASTKAPTTKTADTTQAPTTPSGTENVGLTSGSVDNLLQQGIAKNVIEELANKSNDPIGFVNAANLYTGNPTESLKLVTNELIRQGMSADQIATDLQRIYLGITPTEAQQFATNMVQQNKIQNIANSSNFNDAFRQAREAGLTTFKWGDKSFTTALEPIKKEVETTVTNNLNTFQNTYKDFLPQNRSFQDIVDRAKDLGLTKDGMLPTTSKGLIGATKDVVDAIDTTFSKWLTGSTGVALGTQAQAFSDYLVSRNYLDPDTKFQTIGKDLENYGKSITPQFIDDQRNNFLNTLKQSDGTMDSFLAIAKATAQNPLGAFDLVFKEAIQEGAPIAIAIGGGAILSALGAGTVLTVSGAIATDLTLAYMESAGASYRETYDKMIAQGKTPTQANDTAMLNSKINGLIEVVTELPGAGASAAVIAKTLNNLANDSVLKVGLKEGGAEYVAGFLQSLSTSYLTTGQFDFRAAQQDGALSAALGTAVGSSMYAATPGNNVEVVKSTRDSYEGLLINSKIDPAEARSIANASIGQNAIEAINANSNRPDLRPTDKLTGDITLAEALGSRIVGEPIINVPLNDVNGSVLNLQAELALNDTLGFQNNEVTAKFHANVQKGLAEGTIDPADAQWMSDYANTPGRALVETGTGAWKDQAEKMQNFVGRMERGEIPIVPHMASEFGIVLGGNSSGLNPDSL